MPNGFWGAYGRMLADRRARAAALLAEFGRSVLQASGQAAMTQSRIRYEDAKLAPEQMRAAVSGAVDGATGGTADYVSAAIKSLRRGATGASGSSYRTALAAERAQDNHDAKRYAVARGTGQAGGTIAGVAAIGATPWGAAGAISRSARLVPRVGHVARLGAAQGAVGGVAGEGVSHLVDGNSSWQNYLGAGAGGAVGGVVAPLVGAVPASAVAGAAIPAAQSILIGRVPPMDEVSSGAILGASFGAVGGAHALRLGPNGVLTRSEKEALGERLSLLAAATRGEAVEKAQKRVNLSDATPRSGFTVVDNAMDSGRLVESKFGLMASLTPRQKQALAEAIPNYEVEHWLPRDVAALLGAAGASAVPRPMWDWYFAGARRD